jgi:tetratricopeptide (TPR) repeat protein
MAENPTHTAGPLGDTVAEPTVTRLSPPGYELIDEIGHGGMGVVYRARDVVLDRDVAVKLLSPRYPADSLPAQRFLSEARITGQLQHPGIPAVHQVGALADGRPFLAMKLIKGSTLEGILKQRPDSAAERGRLLAIFEAVCQAVGYAHAHRVIHRDLKPANVMVGAFGEVQVMDWGLAKVLGEESPATTEALAVVQTQAWTQIGSAPERGSHTQAGSLVGTPAFIPPEQALGEIGKVNERSDVFGLGALLAVILTGKPPYVGENYESVRVQAARGKLKDCFARLDGCGAEPELAALCKKCLAFEPADRPGDAGAVAAAVAGLRAAADERARRAELDKVRVEGERAAAEARALERRKRRRLWLGAAAALVLAAVGGLSAVLAVQQQANANLAAKNHELADEQAKVQKRFDMALKAIALFHTGVSEDMLLKNAEFKELRTKLLKEAARFYADLEKLLAGQTDAKSQKALAAAYFELGELTDKIGDQKEALAVHRKALALRREVAAAEGADVETRLDVARSLEKEGQLLNATGDFAGALAAFEEQREVAQRLEAEHSTDAVLSSVASSHHNVAWVLFETGKPEEALALNRKALAIRQKLADANPTGTQFQSPLAASRHNIGVVLKETGKPEEALASWREALAIGQKLADANPAVTQFRSGQAWTHTDIGLVLRDTGKPEEALASLRQASAIFQKLADANPAVTQFQLHLAASHNNIGVVLRETGKPEEALKYLEEKLQLLKEKHGSDHPATLVAVDGVSRGYLAVAAQQAWLGQEQEWAATCERGLSLARETKIVTLADRVAKMCSLRPSNDKRRRAALLLARRAVELGQGNLAWFRMALGMAEYRSGHFAEADAALLAAMETGKGNPRIAGTSAYYRALSLFRQGKPDEARQLATQAAAKMKPLPKDAKNLLAGGANADDLILWLAYKEARDAIEFDEKSGAGAELETRNKAKAAKKEAASK